MARPLNCLVDLLRQPFSKRVRPISENSGVSVHPPFFERTSGRIVVAIGLLAASAGLALLAQGYATEQALQDWNQSHRPGPEVWRGALHGPGLHQIKDAKTIHRALRMLPLRVDRPGSIWTADQMQWLMVFQKWEEVPLVFTVWSGKWIARKTPQSWVPGGLSWFGLIEIVRKIQETQPRAQAMNWLKKQQKPRKGRISDPRQLQY